MDANESYKCFFSRHKMTANQLSLLACPLCHHTLQKKGNVILCTHCHKKLVIKDGIVFNPALVPSDLEISLQSWDTLYKQELSKKEYDGKYRFYMHHFFDDVFDQLNAAKSIKDSIYLEIGCGDFLLGQAIASKCRMIVGVDISASALKIAKKMLDSKHIKNYLLIQSDITHMPIRTGSVDLIYGGGVIEHFKKTLPCLQELYRVLKKGGVAFNTVPYLNIGALTYRQLTGNIPNFPVLKQLAEFVHIRVLKARHMIFGYEMSFTKGLLASLHEQAGFRIVRIERFRIALSFDFIPKCFRRGCAHIAEHVEAFWPMVKIIAVK